MESNARVICPRCRKLIDKCRCPKLYLIAFEAPDVHGSNSASGNAAPEWFNRVHAAVNSELLATCSASNTSPPVHFPDTNDKKSSSETSGTFSLQLLCEMYTKLYTAATVLEGVIRDYEGFCKEAVYYPPLPAGYNSPLYIAFEMVWSPDENVCKIAYRISGPDMASTNPEFTADTTIITAYSFAKLADAYEFAMSSGIPSHVFPRTKVIFNGLWLHLAFIDRRAGVAADILSCSSNSSLRHCPSLSANADELAEPSSSFPVVPVPTPADEDHMRTLYDAALVLHEYLDSIEVFRGADLETTPHAKFDYPLYVAFEVKRLPPETTLDPISDEALDCSKGR